MKITSPSQTTDCSWNSRMLAFVLHIIMYVLCYRLREYSFKTLQIFVPLQIYIVFITKVGVFIERFLVLRCSGEHQMNSQLLVSFICWLDNPTFCSQAQQKAFRPFFVRQELKLGHRSLSEKHFIVFVKEW